MGARYLVTGVQLGIIKGLCETDPTDIQPILDKILLKQYVGDTFNEISEDVLVMKEGKLPNFKK